MSKAPRGRRVPPKARGARPTRPPGEFDAIDGLDAGDTPDASDSPAQASARRTRAQNRAAKRAASGVRPKTGRGQGRKKRSNTPIIALAVAAVAVGAAVLLLGNPFGSPSASASASPGASIPAYGDGTCPTSEPDPMASGDSKLVTIKTEKGDIVIQVDGFLSPIAAGNFVALAECKFYDGVVFHRTATIGGTTTPFVIQGGDPLGTGGGGPGYTISDEAVGTTYKRRHGRDGSLERAAQPGLAVLHRAHGRVRPGPAEQRQQLRDLRERGERHGGRRRDLCGVQRRGDTREPDRDTRTSTLRLVSWVDNVGMARGRRSALLSQ